MNLFGWTPTGLLLKLAPYLLGGAVLAVLAGILMRMGYNMALPRIQRAEQALALFTAKQEALSAAGDAEASRRAGEALKALDEARRGIVDDIKSNFTGLELRIGRDNAALRESINAPVYDCLRNQPLPDDYLRLLSRPGGTAGSNQDR